MRKVSAFLPLFSLLLGGFTVGSGQAWAQGQTGAVAGPPQPAPTSAPATGQAANADISKMALIEGRVLSSTGEPLKKAEVRLMRVDGRRGVEGGGGPVFMMGGPDNNMVTTDDNGRFEFKGLEAGRYMVNAQRTGFVMSSFGARGRGGRGGTPITLTDGQQMKNVEIKLFRQGIVTGRVLDEDGEPMQNVQVMVMRQGYMRGRRQMMPNGGGQVNDLGEYRIANLAPGKYVISVNPAMRGPMGRGGLAPTDKPFDEGYANTYYPSASDPAQATMVEVTQGGEVNGIDFQLRKVRTYRIRGKVLDSNGQPLRQGFVTTMPADEGGMFMGFRGGAPVRGPDGTFELAGLTPGAYNLMVQRGGGDPRMQQIFPVTVGQEHLNGVSIQLTPPITLKGSVRAEGEDKPAVDFGTVRVLLESTGPTPMMAGNNSMVKENGFEMTGVNPGKFRVGAMGLPDGYYLKSVRAAGGQELPNRVLDLSGGVAPNLEVVLSNKAGSVGGIVQDTDGKPASGMTIVMMSADPTKREGMDAFKLSQSDTSGNFNLKNLPPGEWVLFAFLDAEDGAYQDPDWIKKYEASGTRVNVKEKSTEQVTLKVLQPQP
jgi:protocatechuate 3,4-dioxygenase beta subunit